MALLRILYTAWMKFENDDGWAVASHIALSALTALFPFMIFLTALASFFGQKAMAVSASDLLLEGWPPQIATPIYFSSSGVEALRVALNRAYDRRDHRSWWLLRLEAIFFVFVGAASLLTIAFLLVLGPLAAAIAARYVPALVEELAPLFAPVRYGVTSSVLVLGLLAAHKFLPAGRRSLLMIAPGVILTLFVSLAFGVGFGAYLAQFASNYVTTYAGLASIMTALVFLYSLAAIFIFGAELNQAIAHRRAHYGPDFEG